MPPTSNPQPLTLAAQTVAWVIGGFVAISGLSDPDLWGHLRYGLDILRDRALPLTDPYSFTADVRWINHEWLSELLLASAYAAGGVPGMLGLKAVVVGAAFAILSWRSRNAPTPHRWVVLTAMFLLLAPITVTWRPQVWTVLALATLTSTTGLDTRTKMVVWPILFVAWANLHGGWILGLGVLGAWCGGRILDDRRLDEVPSSIGLCLFCLAATLVTPYGTALWGFIWSTVGFQRADIGEWSPIASLGAGAIWLAVVALSAFLLSRSPWSFASALPIAMVALASARVNRLTPLCAVVAVGLCLPRWRARTLAPMPMPKPIVVMLAMTTLAAMTTVLVKQSDCLTPAGSRPPDVRAAGAFLGRSGRLLLPMDWGQFAIWHFAPAIKVSFDGRRETVYSAARIREQHGMARRDLSILPFIELHRPEFIWAARPEGELVVPELRLRGYRLDGQTDASFVLSREDVAPLELGAMSRCFP